MYVVDNATVRDLDEATIEAGTAGLELMERAGAGATDLLLRRPDAPGTGPDRSDGVVVVCGKGNNGGDGLVVARRLHLAGVDVVVALLDPGLEGDAGTNLERARERGVDLVELGDDPAARLRGLLAERPGGWIVDALLGTGLQPPLRAPVDALCRVMNASGRRILALDCPSGLDGDSGAVDDDTPEATLTVTFGLPKWGLFLRPGRGRCGRVEVVDIGFAPERVRARRDPDATALYVDREWAAAHWPRRSVDAHKYRVGSAVVVGGSTGMSGAVTLVCHGLLRAGAGLVEAVVPRGQHAAVDTCCVETLVHPAVQTDAGGLASSAREGILARLEKRDAVVLGPGAGADRETAELLLYLAETISLPMVIDADGLNAAERAGRPHRFGGPAVLTPHSGELARLIDHTAGEIESDRRRIVPEAARQLGAVLVHKGAPTFVAAPDGRLAVIGAGGPALATAGSGDVLSGVIAALLAAGLEPFEAACLGAWVHARAGDLAGEELGDAGVLAGDLPLRVARVGRELEGARG